MKEPSQLSGLEPTPFSLFYTSPLACCAFNLKIISIYLSTQHWSVKTVILQEMLVTVTGVPELC